MYCTLTNKVLTGLQSPPRDYELPGDSISKIFTIIGASANLVFVFNTGMLPEIQVGQTYKFLLQITLAGYSVLILPW